MRNERRTHRPNTAPLPPSVAPIEGLNVRVISDRLKVPFTREKAEEYIDLTVFEGERDATDEHVQELFDEIRRGRFNWDLVTIIKADLNLKDGTIVKTYKINGQHCAWCRMDMSVDDSPLVREIHYEVNSVEQLKALYGTADRGKPRTEAHLVRVELAGTPASQGLTKSTVARLAPAVRFWRWEKREQGAKVTAAELSALINRDHLSTFNVVGQFIARLDKSAGPIILRQPVLAAMLDNFNKVQTVAPEFWQPVAEGDGLAKGEVRWLLNKYLHESVLQTATIGVKKTAVPPEEMYRVCIAAWNKWRNNEKVVNLRPTAKRVKSV